MKEQKNNPSIEKIIQYKWKKIGKWPEFWYHTEKCFLARYSNPLTSSFLAEKINAISLNATWFYEKNSAQKWEHDQIIAAKQNLSFYETLLSDIKKYTTQAENNLYRLSKINKFNYRSFQLFDKTFMLLWYVFLSDIGEHLGDRVDNLVGQQNLSNNQKKQIKDYYLFVHQELGYHKEQKNLINIYKTISNKFDIAKVTVDTMPQKIMNMLEKHRDDYAWIAVSDIDSTPPTIKEYFSRIKEMSHNRELLFKKPELDEKIKKQLNKDTISLLKIFNDILYIDNLTADIFGKTNYLFLTKLSKQYNIPFQDLTWYSWSELNKLIKNGFKINKKALSTRKQFRVMIQIDGQIETFYEKKEFNYIQSILYVKSSMLRTKIQGSCASTGSVKGITKIVTSIKDMHKVKNGDIIVATTTRPDLMPALRRCSAIITDSGGVTSHAAIVSRELNIPCIVGTKNGTEILKDGDCIQVDADKGLITILKSK